MKKLNRLAVKVVSLVVAVMLLNSQFVFAVAHEDIVTTQTRNLANTTLTVDGGTYDGNGGVFNVKSGVTFTITGDNIEFCDNSVTGSSNGGAIYNVGQLNITGSNIIFSDNSSEGGGAGIYNAGGEITIGSNVLFEGNDDVGNGEAIYNTGTITIGSDAVFEQNRGGNGGAIYNTGTIIIENGLTFTDNDAGNDGAILNGGTLTIKDGANFTDNNSSHDGGTMFNGGTITIGKDVTFTNSSAGNDGGAIYNSKTLTIADGATFKGNTAGTTGGAILNNAGIVTIGNNAKFTGNKSLGDYGHGNGGAIYNFNIGKINIGSNAVFADNFSQKSHGGAICNVGSIINIGSNAVFTNNSSKEYFAGAILNNAGIVTIQDGATFKDNTAKEKSGAIYNFAGTVNLIANTNNIEFTGNKQYTGTENEESNAIYNEEGTVNLWASSNASIIFNDKIAGTSNAKTIININRIISGYKEDLGTGTIILNEDMSGYTGKVNLYSGTIKLGENGKWFGGNMDVLNNPTIDIANGIVQEHQFNKLYISNNLKLIVDADLENKKMDTISATSCSETGKIIVNKVKVIKDTKEKEVNITFADDNLKDKVEFSGNIETLKYNYDAVYDNATGAFTFVNSGINMATAAGAVASSVGGYATQSVIINQAFAGIDRQMAVRNQPKIFTPKTSTKQTETKSVTKETTKSAPKATVKPSQKSSLTPADKKQPAKTNGKQNKKSANINSSNLYVSAGNQIFDDSGKIERSLWLRPFALQETIKLNGVDIDNTLYGTLAGIDLPVGQDKQLSFYIGYAGSKQEFDEVKTNQTGYLVGLTGMLIKEKWYLGATVNGIFNKVSADSEGETNDFDMNMFTVGAKVGYNIDLSDKWILEPNITVMYGIANSDSYQTSLGSIDSQSTSNILVEPQVKAKWQLTNGWQPYGLVGYSANLSGKPKVKAGGEELELDSIDGFVEYGIGVNKEFIGSVWSCYGQVTGRSGGRNGFGGNLGIKYKF